MAQTTLDRVTDRVRELADRTGEATSQALSVVLPDRRAVRGRRRRAALRFRLRIGARAGKTAPLAMKSAWQAGELAGRLEGIAGAVPNMTRLWLSRSTAQVRAMTATGTAKTAARTRPTGFTGLRMFARGKANPTARVVPMMRRRAASDQSSTLVKRTIGVAGLTGSIAAMSRRMAANTSDQMSKRARQTTRATRRNWRLTRRTSSIGPLQGTQRTLRRSWRWVRYFTMGFALGAIWAYLFAPRWQTRQRDVTPSSAAEQQRSAAQA